METRLSRTTTLLLCQRQWEKSARQRERSPPISSQNTPSFADQSGATSVLRKEGFLMIETLAKGGVCQGIIATPLSHNAFR